LETYAYTRQNFVELDVNFYWQNRKGGRLRFLDSTVERAFSSRDLGEGEYTSLPRHLSVSENLLSNPYLNILTIRFVNS